MSNKIVCSWKQGREIAVDFYSKPPEIERNETDYIDDIGLKCYMNGHIKLFIVHHLASKRPKLHEEQFWASEHKNKPKENSVVGDYIKSCIDESHLRNPSF